MGVGRTGQAESVRLDIDVDFISMVTRDVHGGIERPYI